MGWLFYYEDPLQAIDKVYSIAVRHKAPNQFSNIQFSCVYIATHRFAEKCWSHVSTPQLIRHKIMDCIKYNKEK